MEASLIPKGLDGIAKGQEFAPELTSVYSE
jgi:hypothetical protein